MFKRICRTTYLSSYASFLLFAVILLFSNPASAQEADPVDEYARVLREQGEPPLPFVKGLMQDYDLLIFDDALHPALEPFRFYQELLRDEEFTRQVRYVFLEAFSIASQPHIDAYLNGETQDSTLLLPVFQNDFSGYGWRYQTYLDLLKTVWDVNRDRPEEERIRVIGVDQPVYWEGIHSRRDYDLFQKSLAGRDYFMYKMVLQEMDGFRSGRKGIFLTNTRHAYKQIRDGEGNLYWNCGTFFNQWHPGKTYSLRFHNVNLFIEQAAAPSGPATSEGLGRYIYRWVAPDSGRWEEAFHRLANRPVAFPLMDNAFGKTPYIGNHMLNAREGQTMSDAYDALIFLAPLDELHFSAQTNFFYTPAFKEELKRRILLLQEGRLEEFLAEEKVDSVEEYIERVTVEEPVRKNSLY